MGVSSNKSEVGGYGVQRLAVHCISFVSTTSLFMTFLCREGWLMERDVTSFALDNLWP